MTLKIDNLGKVWEALYDARSKAYNIGLMLEVPVGTLDSIMKQYPDPSNQLREMLKVWLKMATQQKWQTIVEMLRSRIISEPTLASDIEVKYCESTPGQASGQPRYTHVLIQNVQQQIQASQESQRQIQQQVQAGQESQRQIQQQVQAGQESQRRIQQQVQAGQESQRRIQQQLMELKLQRQSSAHDQRTTDHLQRELQEKQETIPRKLIWQDGLKAPETMCRGSTATDGTTVYFNDSDSTRVYRYHSDSQQWNKLPDLTHSFSTLVMADSKLTSVGGYSGGEGIDSLFSLAGEACRDRKWLQHFPPMATRRYNTAAICHGRSLIVAGGNDGHRLAAVEVLNMDTQLWSFASSLPHPFSRATTSICGERLYLLGGRDQSDQATHSVLTCSISKLLHSCQTLSKIWQRVTDAPYKASSCATLSGKLVVIGGQDEVGKKTTAIIAYNESTNSWLPMEAMKMRRCLALVASLHDNTLMIVGGWVGNTKLDTVEIVKVS